jgi:hypothetical protein
MSQDGTDNERDSTIILRAQTPFPIPNKAFVYLDSLLLLNKAFQ